MRLAARLAGTALGAAIAAAGVAQPFVVAIRTSARTAPATVTPGVRQFQPPMDPIEPGPATHPPHRDASLGVGFFRGHHACAESIDPRTVLLAGDPTFVVGSSDLALKIEADECGRPPDGVGSEADPADVGTRVHSVGIATWTLASALGGMGAFVALPRTRRRRL